ncbi:valine--tRNA ligase [Pelolinea submarina]|uniref:Valine--tRNA ligase n=1 Tax=Pelolinea submarina TaxID=913107 RepID=A0A347ZVF7_9CHLR|nr:valine--tRNA ligase [Pelolinea submarina]REG06985.1 valyl-tRNA synthetase [Pelolinea submarina]BBB49288.1 valyl-tRNA synthetase [Pelolinea submarina]
MTQKELPKAYDFHGTEERIYQWWDSQGYFQPTNDPNKPDFDPTKKPFVIAIPPPNVTGGLHLGHAMFVSIEDLMIRYHRMKGEPTLWIPGSDHAGIATQLQVEKALAQEGKTREDIGREAFIERTWSWKKKYGGMIQQQIRRLGASCDWTRERFTLDDGLSRAVREAFVTLYEKGLIYRGPRLVNWSPNLRTAVSDLEVEHSQEPGTLYYFKYPLADNPEEFLPVATTRPETILGDTAVAVHPDDPRYKKYVGRKALVPMLDREIPIIADEYVDREFGTGALKITPAHDPNDYDIAQRHNLDIINILNKDVTINENGGPYQGLDREECRKRLWADMKARGMVIKEEPYTLNVPRSQRGGEIIEPMISEQWFVKIDSIAKKAIDAVRDGDIRIVPDHFTKVYFNWMENIQDWCISRQLWWGHRIPVWYCDDCKGMTVQREDPAQCQHCGSTHIHQDDDVLDTWFSSGLWPFSTLGWPDETPDLKYFYPTSVLETGYDILFFWVARMIMDGLEFTDEAPFHTVYLHGLIRDEHGQKMSKTKGNVIDPLVVMDKLGTDALRFTLLVGSAPGNDMNLSEKKVEANRNFANKIWNAGRFVINAIANAPEKPEREPVWTPADEWLHARMREVVRNVNRLFESYQFGEAGRQIYDFFWSEFADWYIEIAKMQLRESGDRAFYTAWTLVRVLDKCLRMLSPFTPYVTEELWGHLKQAAQAKSELLCPDDPWAEALMIAQWPESKPEEGWEKEAVEKFANATMEHSRAFRTLKTELNIPANQAASGSIIATHEMLPVLEAQKDLIAYSSALKELEILTAVPDAEVYKQFHSSSIAATGSMIYLHTQEAVVDDKLREKLERELSEANSQIQRLENLLASDFANKAPAKVVENERTKLETYRQTAEKLKKQLK